MRCEHCGELVRIQRPLTRTQRAILDWVSGYIEGAGFSPSFGEIAEAFGYASLATVHEHLNNLEAAGCITREFNRGRSITVLAA